MNAGGLFEHFSIIKDLRQSLKIEHKRFDILCLRCYRRPIEDFGKERLDWLRQYGDFEQGIPGQDHEKDLYDNRLRPISI